MSLLLLKPEIDCLDAGEHNGTFRGNQLAFVGASAAIDYVIENDVWKKVLNNERYIKAYLEQEILSIDSKIQCRGRGMIWGIDFGGFEEKTCNEISKKCFENGVIIETSGRRGSVLKILPPLVINREELTAGLNVIKKTIEDSL